MIVLVATRGYDFTAKALVERTFGTEIPKVRTATYDQLFRARTARSATYLFTDIERMNASELELAADLYRGLRTAGLKCLNDPAVAMGRFELLRTLHRVGVNPFNAYRADSSPRPARFPVILRREHDHEPPLPQLIHSQESLEHWLAQSRRDGVPLRGWIVIEYCSEPIAPGIWRQFGTFRIGDAMHVDHAVVQDSWCAKDGTPGLATPEIIRDTCRAMDTNKFAEEIRPAFEITGIEYGRADHARVGGREVVYEINTNPAIRGPRETRSPLYTEALARSRERFAGLLWQIDSGNGSNVTFPRSERLARYRHRNFWTRPPR